jgi:hypothetical protein
LPVLKRIVHLEGSVTLYLRCPNCSHLEIVRHARDGADSNQAALKSKPGG